MTTGPEFFAFVLMPFAKDFDDVYRLGVKDTAESLGIIAERVDEQIFKEGILERIYRQIEAADLVIADMSGQNPNVFYEVGYAHAKGKLCVLLTRTANDIPFDLKHHRHIVYGTSITDLKKQLKSELAWAKEHVEHARASLLTVKLKSATGTLELTKYAAWGTADFTIDLLNETSHPFADLDAIYLYMGRGWTITHDGRECPSTDSDIPQFNTRHLLTPPVHRLNKKTWAQLRFSGKKQLASVIKGGELKDEYSVTGKMLLRLLTPNRHYDYDLRADVTFYDLPF